MTDERAELAAAIERLETALGALRAELEGSGRGSDADGATRDEPAPEELLRIADEVALPAMEAALLANQQTLVTIRRAVAAAREETRRPVDAGSNAAGDERAERDADEERAERDPDEERAERDPDSETTGTAVDVEVTTDGPEGETDAAEAGTESGDDHRADIEPAIGRVEAALDDLQTAIEGSELPPEGPARDVVSDARSLRREIDERVREATEEADRASRTRIPVESGTGEDGDGAVDDETGADRAGADGAGSGEAGAGGAGADGAAGTDDEPAGSGTIEPDPAGGPSADEIEEEPVVDVEAELETIKREYARRRETLPDWATEDDGAEGGADGGGDGGGDGSSADGRGVAGDDDPGSDA